MKNWGQQFIERSSQKFPKELDGQALLRKGEEDIISMVHGRTHKALDPIDACVMKILLRVRSDQSFCLFLKYESGATIDGKPPPPRRPNDYDSLLDEMVSSMTPTPTPTHRNDNDNDDRSSNLDGHGKGWRTSNPNITIGKCGVHTNLSSCIYHHHHPPPTLTTSATLSSAFP